MQALANGSWLTRDRVIRVAIVAGLTSLLCIGWLFGFAQGTLDATGRPLGSDFSQVWAAGKMALAGHSAEVWSWPQHFEVQRQIHGSPGVDVYGWHYPPPFLLVATALAALPYIPALIVWQASTLGAFAWLMWTLVPRRETILLVLAAPVTLVCLSHGHNGFLTALLLGGGLVLLDRKPFTAGLLLGCLIYKPQFAFVIPPLLLVTRNWRAIGGACAAAAVLIAITLLIWGWPVWQAFLDSLPLTKAVVVEQGNTGWHKIMSPFAAMRMWGAGLAAAYAVQALATAGAVASVLFLALRDNARLRNAAVAAAALIATPYVLDYDFVILGLGIAFLWLDGEVKGFLPWDRSLLALVWAAPLFARQVAEVSLVPLGLATAIIMIALPVRRAIVRASPSHHSPAAFAR
jgi:hypothetical protein